MHCALCRRSVLQFLYNGMKQQGLEVTLHRYYSVIRDAGMREQRRDSSSKQKYVISPRGSYDIQFLPQDEKTN